MVHSNSEASASLPHKQSLGPVQSSEAYAVPEVAEEPEAAMQEKYEQAVSTDPEKDLETTSSPSSESNVTPPEAKAPFNPGADFPDGGTTAWLCVFGGFWALFVSFGWINCIGVFQNYYEQNLLSAYSPSTIAWIPSLEAFFMFIPGPIVGVLYDHYGPRYLLLTGSFLHVFGLMMTSLSTEYYQILLAQGVVSPIGASMIFFSAIASTSTWFFKRRALGLGIVASGSSLGGVIFPILVQQVIPRVGFPWTMRVSAFVILALLIISNLTVRSRLSPTKKKVAFVDFVRPFRELPFFLVTLASFLVFIGLYVPFDFLILQAQAAGVDPFLASFLIPVLNAVSILGRTLPAYLGDRYGRFNMITAFCYLSGLLVLALWLPARATAPIVVFAALYGFTSGAFVSLISACIAQISEIRQIGLRNGSLFAAMSVAGLIGNPIAGALVSDEGGRYDHLQIFSGVMLLAGSSVFLVARIVLAGPGLKKV